VHLGREGYLFNPDLGRIPYSRGSTHVQDTLELDMASVDKLARLVYSSEPVFNQIFLADTATLEGLTRGYWGKASNIIARFFSPYPHRAYYGLLVKLSFFGVLFVL